MRNAMVTGGSRGIGKAIAAKLIADGYNVLIVATNAETLTTAATEIHATTGSTVRTFAADLANDGAIQQLATFCRAEFCPNVLVHAAGIFREGTITDTSPADFDDTLRINLRAIWMLTQALVPLLQRPANIVIIGSTAALEPYDIGAAYGVAKWGLRGYAVNLRATLRPERIGVTLMTPGGTYTDLWAEDDIDPNRLMSPDDVAHMVAAALSVSDRAVVEEIVLRPTLGDLHTDHEE